MLLCLPVLFSALCPLAWGQEGQEEGQGLLSKWQEEGQLPLSKCMRTHLRALQEDRKESETSLEADTVATTLDVQVLMDEMGGKCLVSGHLPDSYSSSCRSPQPEELEEEPSYIVDFNNGRLGNQLSSLASVFALARIAGLRPLISHRSPQHCRRSAET